MWHNLVSAADGSVSVDGTPVVPRDGESAFQAAMLQFTRSADESGAPVLVRSSGQGAQTWFSVSAAGEVAIADAPARPSVPASASVDAAPRTAAPRGDVTPRIAPSAPTSVPTSAPPVVELPAEGPRHRKPSAADFGATVATPAPHPAEQGWRGLLSSLGMRMAPGEPERRERQWRATAQRGLAGHKTVVFVNLKGGATKTTATYLVGATLGRVRGGNLLAWDNNENQGTLGDLALPASHDLTATDLLANVDRFAVPSNSPELMNYMRPQGENRFHVLASQNKASNQEVIDGPAFEQLHGMLRQFYHLILVDTGNAATASTWQAAVEIADEIVLVALNKRDSAKKLAATVDTLIAQELEDKLARGVLLLTEPARPARRGSARDKASDEQRAATVAHFRHYVRDVVTVPYDEALADGAQVVFENLAPATQRAYLAATAAIVDGL